MKEPLKKELSEIPGIVAGDRCFLKELLHPDRDQVALRYSLAHAHVEPGGRTLEHVLDQSEVYYCLDGQATLFINGAPYPLRPGSCVYIPPAANQYVINDGHERFTFLCLVDPAWTAAGEAICLPRDEDAG